VEMQGSNWSVADGVCLDGIEWPMGLG